MPLLVVVALMGAFQGLLLLLLVGVRYRSRENLPFGIFLLGFSLRLGTIPAWTPATLLEHPWVFAIVGPVPLLYGFLVWWYVRELILPEGEGVPGRWWLHGLPWFLETLLLTGFLVSLSPGEYQEFVARLFSPQVPLWMPLRHAGKILLGGVYGILSVRLVFFQTGRDRASSEKMSPVMRRRIVWARCVVVAPILSMGAFLITAFVFPGESSAGQNLASPFIIPAAVMMGSVYGFSLFLLIAPDVLSLTGAKERTGRAPRDGACPDQDDAREIGEKLREVLEQGIYRDTSLTLDRLARCLNVQPRILSAVIHERYSENYTQLIHRYRLNEFIARVQEGGLQGRTILSLAIESGFPSKSTFNRVFKERFGTSPSVYLSESERHRTGL
ncbi:AraC-type DNA-binding protein [Alkalispirochaeta americana]|uniref:AraC-type DNA-binding protein n=1 Tax=Alkalispirochaeta americana TaxID=159291 RepID=A0A1N6VTP9_9SPIO|nr:helix-turn-helix transcriptional regulator [Alkalispirochaeta americana]SIQ81233.1 AraC-type DNA-binding protein [Alkalispirochaeta americana]